MSGLEFQPGWPGKNRPGLHLRKLGQHNILGSFCKKKNILISRIRTLVAWVKLLIRNDLVDNYDL